MQGLVLVMASLCRNDNRERNRFYAVDFQEKNDFNIPSRATGLLSLTYRPDHRFRLGMKVNDRLMQH